MMEPRKIATQLQKLWHQTRDGAVADALERLTAQAMKTVVPLDAGGPNKTFAAWLTRSAAKNPADVPLLLPTLFDGPGSFCKRRLTALHSFAPDPRIGRALARWVLEQVDGDGCWFAGTPVSTAVFGALAVHSDASQLPPLRASYRASDAGPKFKKLDAAIAKQHPRPLTSAERAWLAALRFDDAPVAGHVLLARAQSPEQRAVATDQLLEDGSPRGEFIVLQQQKRARALTSKERKREQELHRQYAKTWLGPLARVLVPESAVFLDGVLVRAQADHTLDLLPEVIDAPEWSSLRTLDFGKWLPDVSVLRRWPSIEEVHVSGDTATLRVALASPPLEVRRFFTSIPSENTASAERSALETLPGLPKLTHLGVSGYWHSPRALRWILKGPAAKRLSAFTIFGELALKEFLESMNEAPRTMERGTMRCTGGRVELTRGNDGSFTEAQVSFLAPESDVKRSFVRFVEALRKTPRGLVRPTLGLIEAPSRALLAELTQAVAAL